MSANSSDDIYEFMLPRTSDASNSFLHFGEGEDSSALHESDKTTLQWGTGTRDTATSPSHASYWLCYRMSLGLFLLWRIGYCSVQNMESGVL